MPELSAITSAFGDALTLHSISVILGGVLLGYIVGVIPGLNRSVAIAIAIPLTFYMSAYAAIAFLIGLSKGTAAGSAVSAILLNTPGEPSSAATCLDGYPMASNGQPRKALKVGLLASVVGDLLSTLLLIVVVIPFASIALKFGPYELAAILIFALVFIAGMAGGSFLKGMAAGGMGVILGTVGLDPETGAMRFTFGYAELMEGVPILPLVIGTLALSEMFVQLEAYRRNKGASSVKLGHNPEDDLSFKEFKSTLPTIFKSTGVGAFVGALPGLGPSVGSFMAYGLAKRGAKDPDSFGKGNPNGIAAAEAADNAVIPASYIPLFGLGIPGSVSAALLVGAFMIHGIQVGPLMLRDHPQMLFTIFAGMVVASLIMLAVGWYGLRIFARVTDVPQNIVIPVVIFLCLAGIQVQGYGTFGLLTVFGFAIFGYFLKKHDYSFVTFLVAFIVTPMLEMNLRQSVILSGGDIGILMQRPIALTFVVATGLLVLHLLWSSYRQYRQRRQHG
ncbi:MULTISPECIES: tripartite tricarboxylate transporter permease [unclassified Halomonas]|uniref:tripartite tricarboxylate transporter permease n=1 Tax=unclassified Halomonas TaxID=2609666 RepID=UPI00054A8AC6|nr:MULTISPECIES: tripartite tricarboxylate transporter permease [unclassified Halomonas]ATH76823.1 Tricarboxylate transporter family protein [Halomonas hydrothermalis]KHJ49853.1 Tricarboxylate transporter family protein [Halomonas hydrothermalis]UDM07580.1 tripartite tricarboxylate transporter permease [Halomonas sp. NyZ770]